MKINQPMSDAQFVVYMAHERGDLSGENVSRIARLLVAANVELKRQSALTMAAGE